MQLSKTKMCAFFERGKCASMNCRYAHSAAELRPPPNLQKTKLCRMFLAGGCNDENCFFAHGESDLRVTEGIYKTQICNFFERGYCKKGDRCNHAHGNLDLRPPRKAQDPFTPAVALKAVTSPAAAKAHGPLTPGAVAPGKENAAASGAPLASGATRQRRQTMALADLITDNEANIMGAPALPSPDKSVVDLAAM